MIVNNVVQAVRLHFANIIISLSTTEPFFIINCSFFLNFNNIMKDQFTTLLGSTFSFDFLWSSIKFLKRTPRSKL